MRGMLVYLIVNMLKDLRRKRGSYNGLENEFTAKQHHEIWVSNSSGIPEGPGSVPAEISLSISPLVM
jgi:hypothetical protein